MLDRVPEIVFRLCGYAVGYVQSGYREALCVRMRRAQLLNTRYMRDISSSRILVRHALHRPVLLPSCLRDVRQFHVRPK